MSRKSATKSVCVSVEKSYWLFESEDVYETDCGRKRPGNEIYGPSHKRIRTESDSSDEEYESSDSEYCIDSSNNPINNIDDDDKGMEVVPFNSQNCECGRELDNHDSITTELFDDIESIGSDYDNGRAIITELFNEIASTSTEYGSESESENEVLFFSDFLNYFKDPDDDEDRVIITEIFDDVEATFPNKSKKT